MNKYVIIKRILFHGLAPGRGGRVRLLSNSVPMFEQKNDEKGYFFRTGGSAQRCHRLGLEKYNICRKGSVSSSGRNGKITQCSGLSKLARQWKGAVSRKTLRKGLFSQKFGTHCLWSFRRSFVQASVPSWGPSTDPPGDQVKLQSCQEGPKEMCNRKKRKARNEQMSHLVTKQQNGMCAQRRLRSAWAASAQSDQSLHCRHEERLGP